jgi:hypothetical protein
VDGIKKILVIYFHSGPGASSGVYILQFGPPKNYLSHLDLRKSIPEMDPCSGSVSFGSVGVLHDAKSSDVVYCYFSLQTFGFRLFR